MGHGEELTLRFAADAFGPVPEGCRRSFLLKTDSYCKDMDLYTAFPDTLEPLPFHGMSGYPYRPDERYPDTAKNAGLSRALQHPRDPRPMIRSGLRRTEFNFRGQSSSHMETSVPAKIEFCTSEPC